MERPENTDSSDRQKGQVLAIPKSMNIVVKIFGGANKTKNEIEKDFQNTLKTWEEIKEKNVFKCNFTCLLKEH